MNKFESSALFKINLTNFDSIERPFRYNIVEKIIVKEIIKCNDNCEVLDPRELYNLPKFRNVNHFLMGYFDDHIDIHILLILCPIHHMRLMLVVSGFVPLSLVIHQEPLD